MHTHAQVQVHSYPSFSNLIGCPAYSPASKATTPSQPFSLLLSSISCHVSYQLLIFLCLKAAPTDAGGTDCRGTPAAAGSAATAASWRPLQLRFPAECCGCRCSPAGTEAGPVATLQPNSIAWVLSSTCLLYVPHFGNNRRTILNKNWLSVRCLRLRKYKKWLNH